MSEDDVVRREFVIVDAGDAEECRRLAASHGVSVESGTTRGEPVLTITLILIGSAAALTLLMAQIERLKGGQVIDLRAEAPRLVYRTRDVLYGLVVIFAADGTVQVDVKQPEDLFVHVVDSLVSMVGDLGAQSIDAIAAVVKESVGDRADVVVRRG